MRIFVAGATGAVGRRLVPRLIGRGHSVTALTRTSAKAAPRAGSNVLSRRVTAVGRIRALVGTSSPRTTRSIRIRRRSSDGLSKLFAIWKTSSPRLQRRQASCCVMAASTVPTPACSKQ